MNWSKNPNGRSDPRNGNTSVSTEFVHKMTSIQVENNHDVFTRITGVIKVPVCFAMNQLPVVSYQVLLSAMGELVVWLKSILPSWQIHQEVRING